VRTAGIVAAGGRGQRIGDGIEKQLRVIGGRTMLERSVTALTEHPAIDEVIVALPAEWLDDPPAFLRRTTKPLRIVSGGEHRHDSVARACAAVSDDVEIVVIHDAARPFVSGDLIARTAEAAARHGAAVAAVASRDTVKKVTVSEGGVPMVHETLPRDRVYLAQTPQAFDRRVLRDLLTVGARDPAATDEATLAERAGHPVCVVEGERLNFKITVPEDMLVADAIAAQQERSSQSHVNMPWRVGTGYDLHRLVSGRALILGGIDIPFERGLLGHSDADAVCHAIIDALLGAAAAGDIGRHFPDDDPRFEGASSLDLLRQARTMVRERGFEIGNVDVVVIAQRPKLAPYVDAIRARLADALEIPVDCVHVKGKTNEGVDAAGREEAIAVHAVALIARRSSQASGSDAPVA
jgi:2-C-methyl-D-erythritol 4-phosphate cytidylyltransferase / 2-C-methyl-D-erythritol 2,4-cyclodiphosphate synthase